MGCKALPPGKEVVGVRKIIQWVLDVLETCAIPIISGVVGSFIGMAIARGLGIL